MRHNYNLVYFGARKKDILYLGQFDPVTMYLDLAVHPSDEFNGHVNTIATQIAGTIDNIPAFSVERVLDKFLGGQFRRTVIAFDDKGGFYTDLADLAGRTEGVAVQDQDDGIAYRLAYRDDLVRFKLAGVDTVKALEQGNFRRTIKVYQFDMFTRCLPPLVDILAIESIARLEQQLHRGKPVFITLSQNLTSYQPQIGGYRLKKGDF